MVILSNSELRALFVQYQQHRSCIGVHISRGLFFGKLNFRWEEPERKVEPKTRK